MPRQSIAAVRRSENRNGSQVQHASLSHGNRKDDIGEEKEKLEKLYSKKAEIDDEWQPSMSSVVKLLLSLRISSALWGIISDCDEVYNYWEPLHLFLYGRGFQTWEYSPVYAIRSYLYVFIHYIPASIIGLFSSKIVVFVLMRCLIGVVCLKGEYLLFLAICRKINIASGRIFVIFSMFSSGMFLASTAFLPSSFAMIINFYFLAAYLNEEWPKAIGLTALAAMVGWPFAAILGLPVVIDMVLIKNQKVAFLLWSLIFGFSIGIALYICDSFFFGKTVFAPLNIVLYNVLSGPGPELYGVEPISYYIKNLLLNWNIAIPLAVISLPCSVHCYMVHSVPSEIHKIKFGIPRSLHYWKRYIPVFLIWFTAATWCAIFFTQPHKEERFLFPIYPHIACLAGIGFEAITRIALRKRGNLFSNLLWGSVLIFLILSGSRTYTVYKNYGAHIEIYKTLSENIGMTEHNGLTNANNSSIKVCVGKEWHRFPSSFFLPEKDEIGREVELQFIESEFRGLLPKLYKTDKRLVQSTRFIPTEMNDRNLEEVSRYVKIDTCDYIIDVDMPASNREIDFRTLPNQFEPLVRIPFIIAEQSHPLFRAFYVPFLSKKYTTWTNYTLYRKIQH